MATGAETPVTVMVTVTVVPAVLRATLVLDVPQQTAEAETLNLSSKKGMVSSYQHTCWRFAVFGGLRTSVDVRRDLL
jgi:hypothetical protein